jgi:hypothetical protein
LKNALTTAKKLGIAVDDIFQNSRPESATIPFISLEANTLSRFADCQLTSSQ